MINLIRTVSILRAESTHTLSDESNAAKPTPYQARWDAGFTSQKKLAEAAGLPLHRVNSIEDERKGKKVPPEFRVKYAKALGLKLSDINWRE